MPTDTDLRTRVGMRMVFAVLLGLLVFGYGGAVENLAGSGALGGPEDPPAAAGPSAPAPAPPGASRPDDSGDSAPAAISGDPAENKAFVTIMRSYLAAGPDLSRPALIELGHDACRALEQVQPDDTGGLTEAVAHSGVEASHPGEAHVVFGAATSAYCPQWNWLFRS